jgi:hypothetical protein
VKKGKGVKDSTFGHYQVLRDLKFIYQGQFYNQVPSGLLGLMTTMNCDWILSMELFSSL